MSTPPGLAPGSRWRCDACGNLTRFDVESTERVRRFWHLDLSGAGAVDEEEVLDSTVESVTCRWCGARDTVRAEPAPAPGPQTHQTDHA